MQTVDLQFNRREFLASAGSAILTFPALSVPMLGETEGSASAGMPDLAGVKALVFDVFGTMVDWRSSVIAESAAWGKQKGLQIDWAQFADRWRLGYQPAMGKVRRGDIPWTRLDDLQRMILDDLLKEYDIQGLSEEDKTAWSRVWRRLKPWPDAVEGLSLLRRKYIVAPMSNANIALMVGLARFAGFQWDAILGAELARHYKPDAEAYNSAPYYLDLKPEEVMMVAAHVGDLKAACACGLRTGFIYRPDEYGNGSVRVPDKAQPGDFDLVAASAIDLARQLGA
jgi:2-haloacid dehalogenase